GAIKCVAVDGPCPGFPFGPLGAGEPRRVGMEVGLDVVDVRGLSDPFEADGVRGFGGHGWRVAVARAVPGCGVVEACDGGGLVALDRADVGGDHRPTAPDDLDVDGNVTDGVASD